MLRYLDYFEAKSEQFFGAGFVVFAEIFAQAAVANELHHEQHCLLCHQHQQHSRVIT